MATWHCLEKDRLPGRGYHGWAKSFRDLIGCTFFFCVSPSEWWCFFVWNIFQCDAYHIHPSTNYPTLFFLLLKVTMCCFILAMQSIGQLSCGQMYVDLFQEKSMFHLAYIDDLEVLLVTCLFIWVMLMVVERVLRTSCDHGWQLLCIPDDSTKHVRLDNWNTETYSVDNMYIYMYIFMYIFSVIHIHMYVHTPRPL